MPTRLEYLGTYGVQMHNSNLLRDLSSKQYLTVPQVAKILAASADYVTRTFANLDGAIDLGAPERMHKRRKRMLRIPPPTVERFIADKQTKRSRK